MDRLNRWTTRQTEWMYSMDGWMDGQMDRWTDGGTNRQIGHTVILPDGQTDRWIGTDGIDRLMDR